HLQRRRQAVRGAPGRARRRLAEVVRRQQRGAGEDRAVLDALRVRALSRSGSKGRVAGRRALSFSQRIAAHSREPLPQNATPASGVASPGPCGCSSTEAATAAISCSRRQVAALGGKSAPGSAVLTPP